jgi:hypothetical protein
MQRLNQRRTAVLVLFSSARDLGDIQARKQTAAMAAAADAMVGASGYGSDEEVYATARAMDDADDGDLDSSAPIDRKKIEPLPPLDHASIEYDDFAKNFFDEHPAMTSMTHAEVRQQSRSCPCCWTWIQLMTCPGLPRIFIVQGLL